MTEKQKKTKQPVYGIYFPSEFPTIQGNLLINCSIDILKLLENHADLPEELLTLVKEHYQKTGKRKYLKMCISKNRHPDLDGNIYFPFINTYTHE